MMSKIYSEAIAVLAWLGSEADFSGEVMDEISRVGTIIVRHLGRTPYPRDAKDDVIAAMEVSAQKLVLLMLSWIGLLTDPDKTGR